MKRVLRWRFTRLQLGDKVLGYFITVEGGEGVGKTHFIQGLGDQLRKLSTKQVVLSREPGGTLSGEAVRSLFLQNFAQEPWDKLAEFSLMSAARRQHVRYTIEPNLAQDRIVLCDRFVDSSLVYQGYLGAVDRSLISSYSRHVVGDCWPHLTLILDCPVEVSSQRVGARKSSEGMSRFDQEALSFHEKVRQAFLDIAHLDTDRCVVLDASASPDEVLKEGVAIIKRKFGHEL